MKTYLVTGGAGFIGSNFIIYMLNKYNDIKIINVDILTYAGNLENLKSVENNPNYSFYQADIKDYDAIQVAIFSIYLTLLDYQEPADIEKFQFPPLYGINLICSDTFDTNDKGLNNLKNIIFDYIIGNPPWKGAGGNELAKNYLKKQKTERKSSKK